MSERPFQAIAENARFIRCKCGDCVQELERLIQATVEATWGIARESHREEWSLESHQDPVPDYAYTNIVACMSELLKESKRV